jgi:hypothetical protein
MNRAAVRLSSGLGPTAVHRKVSVPESVRAACVRIQAISMRFAECRVAGTSRHREKECVAFQPRHNTTQFDRPAEIKWVICSSGKIPRPCAAVTGAQEKPSCSPENRYFPRRSIIDVGIESLYKLLIRLCYLMRHAKSSPPTEDSKNLCPSSTATRRVVFQQNSGTGLK